MTLANPNDETDPAARRKRVEELWAPDGIYANVIAVVFRP